MFDLSLVLLQAGAAETILSLLREIVSGILLFLPRCLLDNPVEMLRLVL